ncbi:MAG TPA: alkaline phosphatase family protein [Thermoplasmata archaeon]|nr:alkaline phosphatase family protein [Thermoplasmata archaeon]
MKKLPPRRPTPGPSLGEVGELVAPKGPLSLPIPDYRGRSLPNLSANLVGATRPSSASAPTFVPPLDPRLDPFHGSPSEGPIVLFLVDGLGWFDFVRWARDRPKGRGEPWERAAHPITTVFPSTTTAALCSLSTAAAPGRHGLLGYRQYLPRFGMVADMLKFSPTGIETRDLLVGPEWRPEHLTETPTIFRQGVRASAITRDRFQGTGFTRLLYDGAEFVGYATATDLAHELRTLLEGEAPPLITVYWDELDTIQHLKGTDPELVDLEIERTIQLIEYVATHLPTERARAVTLLVTGDHGQVPATPEARIAIDAIPSVAAELARPLAGDRRAGFFAARPGRVEALREALVGALPEGARVIPMPEAVEAGLFGPPPFHAEIHERLGDLLALVPSPASLAYRLPGMALPKRFLFGAHGGLEPAELLVPLVAGRLDAVAACGERPLTKR